jgi:homoserine kinase
VPDRADGLVHVGFRAAFVRLGRPVPTVAFEAHNPIPLARGLGSSSAALVAGAALADAWCDGALGRDGVFQLAAELEGHPDNVAPAVYGGFTVSAPRPRAATPPRCWPSRPPGGSCSGCPTFQLPTAKARAALPTSVHRDDAVRTASRAALWALAVARDEPELLRTASIDVLHEPYREPLVPGLRDARTGAARSGRLRRVPVGCRTDDRRGDARIRREGLPRRLGALRGPRGRVLALHAAPATRWATERRSESASRPQHLERALAGGRRVAPRGPPASSAS